MTKNDFFPLKNPVLAAEISWLDEYLPQAQSHQQIALLRQLPLDGCTHSEMAANEILSIFRI
jgi:hypothetical protein